MGSGSGKKMGKEKLCVGLLFLVFVHEDVCAVGESSLVVTAYACLSLQV